MHRQKEIVVTGLGAITPIGLSVERFLQSLREGRIGVKTRPELAAAGGPYSIGATIDDFDGKQFIRPRKAIKVMCRPIQFGFAAAWMAAEQAKLFDGACNPDRLGIVFGAETFYADPLEMAPAFSACSKNGMFTHSLWGTHGLAQIPPLWMLQYLANMIASHISIAVDARGPSNTICQGGVSSSLALIEGAELLQRGWADAVIVGGASSQTMMTALVYRGDHRLSRRVDDPARACRPFDADRDGMVLGEGAGAVVLETAESAARRGVPALAHVAGWARGFATGALERRAQRIAEVAQNALTRAQIQASDLSHINAVGLATVDDDVVEAAGILAFAPAVPVIALKANLGNLGPGADVVELIGSIGALQTQRLFPAPNFETPDVHCPIRIDREAISRGQRDALKLAVAHTGQVTAIVIRV